MLEQNSDLVNNDFNNGIKTIQGSLALKQSGGGKLIAKTVSENAGKTLIKTLGKVALPVNVLMAGVEVI
ncbi:MAG: hypothetical protein KAJ62_09490 [Desulfobacteraceae bacterium]|nr:hypothetical protein [Desulfobacteraceae bacterium]